MCRNAVLTLLAAGIAGLIGSSPAVAQDTGVIKGIVKWEGRTPPRKKINTQADPKCAAMHAKDPLLSERLVIKDERIQWVFVYVKSGLPDKEWETPKEAVVLDQKGCHYVPHVFGVMVGQELKVKNSDPTSHNINCTPDKNTGFNKGQPKPGMEFTETFKNPEMMIPFKCDVHPWMSAYCAVMEHPFFDTTNEKGEFRIEGLPPGEYEISTWIERKPLQPQTKMVTVSPGAETEVEFSYTRPGRK